MIHILSLLGLLAYILLIARVLSGCDVNSCNVSYVIYFPINKIVCLKTLRPLIVAFEHLAFRTEGMTDALFRECFISGLKDEIWDHVLMARPLSCVEATRKDKEAQ